METGRPLARRSLMSKASSGPPDSSGRPSVATVRCRGAPCSLRNDSARSSSFADRIWHADSFFVKIFEKPLMEIKLTWCGWRLFLTCFMVFVLCFQGIAQASVASCVGTHPSQALLISAAHTDGAHASAGHADHQHHAKAEKAKIFQDKCDRCAPCCTGTAMLPANSIVIAAPVVAQDFPALTVTEHSSDRGRLDRPPRAFLA